MVGNSLKARFTKLTNNIVGVLESAGELSHQDIVEIAKFYHFNTEASVFKYHFITPEGAEKAGSKLPALNYKYFIEYI